MYYFLQFWALAGLIPLWFLWSMWYYLGSLMQINSSMSLACARLFKMVSFTCLKVASLSLDGQNNEGLARTFSLQKFSPSLFTWQL